MDFIEKNTTVFTKLIQYLDNKSLSLVMRDAKNNDPLTEKFGAHCPIYW